MLGSEVLNSGRDKEIVILDVADNALLIVVVTVRINHDIAQIL